MRMALAVSGGIVLLGLSGLHGGLWGGMTSGAALVAKLFIPVWVLVGLINMLMGVTRADYSMKEELAILLVALSVPVALTILAIWRLAR